MTDKLEYYDILGVVVPGILLVVWVPFCFPAVLCLASTMRFPDAFAVLGLTVVAAFLGQLLQAIASLLEPLLFATWGGRPSDQALQKGLAGYLPKETATRIREKLTAAVGVGTSSDHSLFLFAMQTADATERTRTPKFNALYGYHRSLFFSTLFAIVLLAASPTVGRAHTWPWHQLLTSLLAVAAIGALLWNRTRQRAFYYVREVLLTAERTLDTQQARKETGNV